MSTRYPGTIDPSIAQLLRAADAPDRLVARVRSLAPDLAITGALAGAAPPAVDEPDRAEAGWLAREGYAVLPGAVPDRETRTRLISAIEGVMAVGLPAVFVYLLDDIWLAGERLRARASAMLGTRYVLGEDGWAWSIPPGGAGWPQHRDDGRPFDRAAPERLNVWVALSDVTAERACMYVVPLDADPDYPAMTGPAAPPLETIRALPVPGGTALAWNANLLHWGGGCSLRAPGPRVAFSFTFFRADYLARNKERTVDAARLDVPARLDMIAQVIDSYGGDKRPPDVSPAVARWAAASAALRARIED